MSMYTNVCGFAPPDATWKKMKAIYDSCNEARVEIPDKVDEFFDGEPPDNSGVRIELDGHDCCTDFNEEMQEGFQIEIAKVPKNIKFIRFYIAFKRSYLK